MHGNEGFVLQIPFLECVFGTKYFVVDKQNSYMMGIFNDKVETIEAEVQMKPFNLVQLSCMITMVEQHRQGFNESSVAGSVAPTEAPVMNRVQYPSTPHDFESFSSLRDLKYDGNMLTPEERSGLYWDCTKVIVGMAEAYKAFARCLWFNPEMADKYQGNIDKYTAYYTGIIRGLDIFLQEDQLMRTKLWFPLVPAPTYMPSMHEMEHNTVRKI